MAADVPPRLFFVSVAIFGGSVIPTYGIVTAHVNDMVRRGEFVAAAGGLNILQGMDPGVRHGESRSRTVRTWRNAFV